MSMRIAVGGLFHETNTYVRDHTEQQDFDVLRGAEVEARFAGTATAVGGILAGIEEADHRAVPLTHAFAEPSGTLAASCYHDLSKSLLDGLLAAQPLDIVVLDLHGAGVAVGADDIEADLCRRIREALGDDVILAAMLDLHGNVTQEMANELDVALACREYPHTDFFDRGRETVRIAVRLIAEGKRGKVNVERVPLLIGAGPKSCTQGPGAASEIRDLCCKLSERPGVLDCSFFHGFVPSDVPGAAAAIMVTTDSESEVGREVAREAASLLWAARRDFAEELPSPSEAVRQALSRSEGPIVINDIGDNPGGGAPGDCTRLLAAMLDAGAEESCIGVLFDPAAVAAATAAGCGAEIDVSLGGKISDRQGQPLAVTASVKSLSDGRFELRAMWRGMEMDMGPMARLRVGGVDVLVGSRRHQVFDP
jgi:microcystin degradation protein MlrC